MQINKPLLEGSLNTRELGGYPCKSNRTVRFNRFLRSDGLFRITEKDRKLLKQKGLTLIIDLRSRFETEFCPDPDLGVEYVNFPLLDHINSGITEQSGQFELNEMYSSILVHNSDMIRDIMICLAESQGCVLFHCTAGKDRTGVIAMLLLGLAEVDERIIAEDYAASAMNLNPFIQEKKAAFQAQGIRNADHLLSSSVQQMRGTLEFIHRYFGSVKQYLEQIGLSYSQITLLQQSLWEEGKHHG